MYKAYGVVANPDAPDNILSLIGAIATRLEAMGYTLRTAGGNGLEEAFEKTTETKEVYLPWRNFNNRQSKFTRNMPEANDVVRPFAPSFDTLKPAVQAIIASKAHTVLGKDLKSPIQFLITYTADGCETVGNKTAKTGFSGTSIAIASSMRIPVFNLKNADAVDRLKQYLSSQS